MASSLDREMALRGLELYLSVAFNQVATRKLQGIGVTLESQAGSRQEDEEANHINEAKTDFSAIRQVCFAPRVAV